MADRSFELFDEYAAAYARGERPSAEEYLQRAGGDREELSSLLDGFLRRAPVPKPNDDDRRLLGLMLAVDPPVLALRVERGLRVDEVVDALIQRLGLEPLKAAKLKRYYQRLEGGLLDPRGLSTRLRAALADVLGPGVETALTWTAPPAAAAPAFLRRAEYLEATLAASAPAADGDDEVDRLFTAGE